MNKLISTLLLLLPIAINAQILHVEGTLKLDPVDTSNPEGLLLMQNSNDLITGKSIDELPFVPLVDSVNWPQPNNPTLSGSLGIGSSQRSVSVQGSYAYVVGDGSGDIKVIDVSNPASPSLSGSLAIGPGPRSVAVQDNYAYVVDYSADDIKVIDVSNPASPSLSGSLGIGSSPRAVAVQGNYAYVVDFFTDDIKVIDVSNPASPSLSGSLGIGSSPRAVAVQGNYAYAVNFSSNDIAVIDVSNPASPVLTGSLGIGSAPSSVAVQGNYTYVVDSNSEDIKVIDVSNPASPALSGSLGIGSNPRSVVVQGNYAYVADASSKDIKVIDVSNPASPMLVSSLGIGTSPTYMAVQGNYAYVVDHSIKVIALSEPNVLTIDGGGAYAAISSDQISPWKKQASDISYNQGDVGLGTMSPLSKLDVRGNVLLKTSGQGPRLNFAEQDGSGISLHYYAAADELRFEVRSDNGNTHVDDLVRFESGGNLYFKDDSDIFNLDKIVGFNDLRLYGEGGQPLAILIKSPSDIRMPGLLFGDFKTVQYDDSNGRLYYDNSSARYKTNITDLDEDFMQILKATPKKYTRPGNENRWEIGFIAEEIDDLGIKPLVGYDQDDRPDDFNYRKMVIYLNEVNKIQQERIEMLEAQVAELLTKKRKRRKK